MCSETSKRPKVVPLSFPQYFHTCGNDKSQKPSLGLIQFLARMTRDPTPHLQNFMSRCCWGVPPFVLCSQDEDGFSLNGTHAAREKFEGHLRPPTGHTQDFHSHLSTCIHCHLVGFMVMRRGNASVLRMEWGSRRIVSIS